MKGLLQPGQDSGDAFGAITSILSLHLSKPHCLKS
jgi:hypothetical protein